MTTRSIETAAHCAYCGHPVPAGVDAPDRFGEPFCSEEQDGTLTFTSHAAT